MALANSIRVAVVLALFTYPDSHIGEKVPDGAIDLAIEEGLMGKTPDGGLYMTDAGRDHMTKVLESVK